MSDNATRKKKSKGLVLELPLDLLLCVIDFLPLPGLLCLQRTCRSLRNALRKRLRHDAVHAPADEMLEALTIFTFDNPDKWACHICLCLHSILFHDTPHTLRMNPNIRNLQVSHILAALQMLTVLPMLQQMIRITQTVTGSLSSGRVPTAEASIAISARYGAATEYNTIMYS
ncbi:f-box domain-containing protein [Cordyceps javanica]|nr:f-box domain-containing protein [Cordyceps javanica]